VISLLHAAPTVAESVRIGSWPYPHQLALARAAAPPQCGAQHDGDLLRPCDRIDQTLRVQECAKRFAGEPSSNADLINEILPRRDLGPPSVSLGKNEKWGAFAVRRPPAPYLGRNVLAKSSSLDRALDSRPGWSSDASSAKPKAKGMARELSRKYRSGCLKNMVNIWIDGQTIASVYLSLGKALNWATPGQNLGSESVQQECFFGNTCAKTATAPDGSGIS
jgi:hypothetical protein